MCLIGTGRTYPLSEPSPTTRHRLSIPSTRGISRFFTRDSRVQKLSWRGVSTQYPRKYLLKKGHISLKHQHLDLKILPTTSVPFHIPCFFLIQVTNISKWDSPWFSNHFRLHWSASNGYQHLQRHRHLATAGGSLMAEFLKEATMVDDSIQNPPERPETMHIWRFPKMVVPQNGGFIIENPIKMDDLGVPLFSETSIYDMNVLLMVQKSQTTTWNV